MKQNVLMARSKYTSVVTGGTRGIGKEIVAVLRKRGDNVFTVSRRSLNRRDHIAVDLSCSENISRLTRIFGRKKIDNLVLCHRYRGDSLIEEIDVSFQGMHQVVDCLTNNLSKNSSIVIVGSIASQFIIDEQPFVYHGTRAALENLARYLSVRLGPSGVRCNCVMPTTLIKSENKDFFTTDNPVRRLLEEITPLQKMGKASDIAYLLEFLCSDKSSFISGQSIVVDGGLSAVSQESIARRLTGLSHPRR